MRRWDVGAVQPAKRAVESAQGHVQRDSSCRERVAAVLAAVPTNRGHLCLLWRGRHRILLPPGLGRSARGVRRRRMLEHALLHCHDQLHSPPAATTPLVAHGHS